MARVNTALKTSSDINCHMGHTLCVIASEYPTIVDVILEQVQNAIDANGGNISVVLNRKTRHIAVRDDGDGVSRLKFEEALRRICLSQKERGKLGRFGMGVISPLNKCHSFTFTSYPIGNENGYMEWSFVTDDIRSQEQDVTTPCKPRPELIFVANDRVRAKKGQTAVMWRTEVNIWKYSTDKVISRISSIDALAEAILERFGTAMRRNKVILNLKFINEDGTAEERKSIRAKLFTGRSLGDIVINDDDAGKIIFRLYLATRTTKGLNGKVIVGEIDDDYRFGFNHFARAAEGLIPADVTSSLLSGVFEGEILGEKVQLDPNRKAFLKNDSFVGFCTAIESWFKKYGEKHLEEVREARRDQRYQELGMQSLREIEEMLQNPAFAEIKSVLSDFALGSIGVGHTDLPEKIAGKQEEHSVSTREGFIPKTETIGEGTEREPASTDKPAHHPFTVAGPHGRQRTLVKRDSLGLQFSYVKMNDSGRLWEFDTRRGILHFNTEHATWVFCDVSDRKIKQLQETIAIHALILMAMPEEMVESFRYYLDESLKPLTFLFHSSPAFNLRKRT